MGNAKDEHNVSTMQCQDCHGQMSAVGHWSRDGWLDQPNCQSCHHDGKRFTSAIDPQTNTLREVLDDRFATNPDTPMAGKSLYRFSTGHGNLQCAACHGPTHAIYPAHEADNFVSMEVQGHTGTISECMACHETSPKTVSGGPHGMHSIGQEWVDGHSRAATSRLNECNACHGEDYRGSVLSAMWQDRTLTAKDSVKKFKKGHEVSCYDCHNGERGY